MRTGESPGGPLARFFFAAPAPPRFCYPWCIDITHRQADMIHRVLTRVRPLTVLGLAAGLAACAGQPSHPPDPNDPAGQQQYVSIVNSLNWTNALSGKRDGARSSWPVGQAAEHEEIFPLAQLKQCKGEGACAWGVMSARRSYGPVHYVPGGLTVEVVLHVDVNRRQEMHKPEFNTAMAIPGDVAGLRYTKDVRRVLTLHYGKIEHIDFDYGVGFDVCPLRYDAAGHALDACDIPFI